VNEIRHPSRERDPTPPRALLLQVRNVHTFEPRHAVEFALARTGSDVVFQILSEPHALRAGHADMPRLRVRIVIHLQGDDALEGPPFPPTRGGPTPFP